MPAFGRYHRQTMNEAGIRIQPASALRILGQFQAQIPCTMHCYCARGSALRRRLQKAPHFPGGVSSGVSAGSPASSTSHAHSMRFQDGTGVRTAGRGTNLEGSILFILWM